MELSKSPFVDCVIVGVFVNSKNNQAAAIKLLLRESSHLIKKFKFCWWVSEEC